MTCNFREKECVQETYRLLNEYADELYGKSNVEKANSGSDDDDISKQLESQIEQTKVEVKEKAKRFLKLDTGTTNCLFIKTTLDARELGIKIIQDLVETQKKKSKNILRFVPVSATCKAKVEDIVNCCGPLCDKYFLKEASSFSIVFNKRYNNDIKRDQVIKEVANLISHKNINNKVDLRSPQLTVLIEVIKGLCAISILPNYIQYKKYNLNELYAKDHPKVADETDTPVEAVETQDDKLNPGPSSEVEEKTI